MNDAQPSKIALITGGGRGLGRDMALSLAQAGVQVIVTYLSRSAEAEAVVSELLGIGVRAAAMPLDVGSVASFGAFTDRLRTLLRDTFDAERIDFLVNNAGIGKTIPIEKLTEEEFDLFLNIHFKGVTFLTQKMLAMMNDGGSVVFITAAGDRFIVPGYAVYGAAKGAVEVFSRYVAKEYGPRGIRANTVAPGGIVTDFNNAAIRSNPAAQTYIVAQTALGRLGQANDIGGVVAFLCSDAAKWMTGQRLEVAGGFNL